ncbi:tRNA synthetases class II-domain-containing protein [Geopyxis carbonaria]|nr:tRNA synthetases class II-domain-containing protein [Geopyxis carbonaria]
MNKAASVCLRCRLGLPRPLLARTFPAILRRRYATPHSADDGATTTTTSTTNTKPKTEGQQFLTQLKTARPRVREEEEEYELTEEEERAMEERDAAQVLQTYEELLGLGKGEKESATESGSETKAAEESAEAAEDKEGDLFSRMQERFNYPAATHTVADIQRDFASMQGQLIVLHGYFNKARRAGSGLAFAEFYTHSRDGRQFLPAMARAEDCSPAVVASLLSLPPFAPVAIRATVSRRASKRTGEQEPHLRLDALHVLNSVHRSLVHARDTVYPAAQRHLQLRTDGKLGYAMRLRAKVASKCRALLEDAGFLEVDTPLLFKSTPEGAREFLVPTRRRDGAAYALPQSPQQYKQMLMASGVARYYQLARCFRDEDGRADRQPEFTQLDLEMGFARGADVMALVERLVRTVFNDAAGARLPDAPFARKTWLECMRKFGSDKPDLRFGDFLQIHRITYRRAGRDKPTTTEGFVLRPKAGADPAAVAALLAGFLAEHAESGSDAVKAYIADESAAHGVPALDLTAADIDAVHEALGATLGDIVVLKPRRGPYVGGSTRLGQLRTALISRAVVAELIHTPPPTRFTFLWVTDFPLFTPSVASEPGQAGTAGLQSTHHPFTAPHPDDLHLLSTSPAAVRAEHYDLVVNGVELGGGSRRIHDPALQRYVLESVLRVPPARVREFEHLLAALGSGCPPHAGLALGFDRMIALLAGTESVRDVIAFPKNSKGADPAVGSPSVVGDEALGEYGLKRVKE